MASIQVIASKLALENGNGPVASVAPNLGLLGQAALGCQRTRRRNCLFMNVNADYRSTGGSGDAQRRASCSTFAHLDRPNREALVSAISKALGIVRSLRAA